MTNPDSPHLSNVAPQRAEYAALVREAADGNAGAMEALLTRAQEAAYRFSLLVCGHQEDAEEVMQDALLKTYRHVRRIRKPEAFRTWLYQTVRTACLMKRRRRVDEPSHLVPLDPGAAGANGEHIVDVEARGPAADQQMIDTWVRGRLRQALAALPGPLRAIVVLREIEGLSTRDVAEVMGISEGNVKTRLHRARLRLRSQLEDL